ncbi:MAG: amino acid permease [Pyrinomonadaceae bacterium]|nr:amino acid permease [Blastocatellia bacterium]MDQ3220375.1 amino acid permease [Acidobacteriota bacterium]MDQ3490560.1 amino acid permease [Acidobacteriota bacterium]
MSTSLFRKKSIAQIQSDAAAGMTEHAQEGVGGEGGGLRRTLGVFDLTLMGIAAIVGAGIFAMIGKASYNGGPAVALLFVFTAFACGFSALCYAEFASRIPVAGSAYTYAYASMGEFIAWIIGWDLIVEYAIGNIAVAISWSDYFTGLLKGYGINFPLHFTMDFLTAKRGYAAVQDAAAGGAAIDTLAAGCRSADAAVSCNQFDAYTAWLNSPNIAGIPIVADIPALMIVVIITTLVYIGIRESKFAANIMTVLKIGIILLVIFLGLNYVNPENWSPFAPNGIEGVLKGVSAVFFAYIGFDALSTTAEECKNPRRDLPRAMILSLVICTVLYITLALVLTGMVSYTTLDVGDPLAFVFGPAGADIPWVAGIISVSAVIALATVFLVFQIGQPRLWMAMSRDGLLPRIFSSIHPKFKTPWFATIITGLVVAIPALFMNLTEVTDLASIGTLFAFVVVCAGVLFKDKEFKESGTRYVPYINSQFILPVILAAVFGTVYYFNPTFLRDFLTLTPAEGESMLGAFSHKIPLIFFFIVAVLLVFLSLTKKLSLIPILGLLSCLYLMTELGITNWMRFGLWLIAGLIIYALYGYRNSHLHREEGAEV